MKKDWPVIWVCPKCERRYKGDGWCTAYIHNTDGRPGLIQIAMPQDMYDKIFGFEKIGGFFHLAAPPEYIVNQAYELAKEKGWVE